MARNDATPRHPRPGRCRELAPPPNPSIGLTLHGMTIKLVVLYTQPEDSAAFDEHYLGVHGPL
ncbi:MAG TPA: hypothetical protein VFE19_05950, partial [Jatrophihabitantaceae bacterium]|nr:hypothetical protein [Jatrophihabitantaceae bacterium]